MSSTKTGNLGQRCGKSVSNGYRKPTISLLILSPGFMKHLPNLLKQETSSASTLVTVLVQMYYDPRPEHQAIRVQVAERLMPYVYLSHFLDEVPTYRSKG